MSKSKLVLLVAFIKSINFMLFKSGINDAVLLYVPLPGKDVLAFQGVYFSKYN